MWPRTGASEEIVLNSYNEIHCKTQNLKQTLHHWNRPLHALCPSISPLTPSIFCKPKPSSSEGEALLAPAAAQVCGQPAHSFMFWKGFGPRQASLRCTFLPYLYHSPQLRKTFPSSSFLRYFGPLCRSPGAWERVLSVPRQRSSWAPSSSLTGLSLFQPLPSCRRTSTS